MDKSLLNDVEIYGISGKLGTGKNFIAEKIFLKMMEPVPTVIMSFADQIKVNSIVQHGLDRYKCFVEKDEHTRKTMQRVGTEKGRNIHGHDIWLRYTLEWMLVHASRGVKRIIVPDVRFHNEFDFIKDLGGTMIRVNAEKRNKAALEREAAKGAGTAEQIGSHTSETELDHGRTFDYVIDNDIDAQSVFVQVRDMIRTIKRRNKKDLVIFCDLDNTICECNEYYILQAEKVKSMISKELVEFDVDGFEAKFSESVKNHNGKYSHSFFRIERFADSLVSIVKDFEQYMRPDVDIDDMLKKAYRWGMEVFDYSYLEIDDRVTQLRELGKLGKVVIFTMGDRLEQVKKIAELGIMDLEYEVFDFKDETIFRHLCNKYPADLYCMIGDSLQRDVLPAIGAGLDIVIRVNDTKESYWSDDADHPREYHDVSDLSEARDIIVDKLHERRIERTALNAYIRSEF